MVICTRLYGAERDLHDETLKLDGVLCEKALQRLDNAKEWEEPQGMLCEQGSQVLEAVDPEEPLMLDDGTVAGGLTRGTMTTPTRASQASPARLVTANRRLRVMTSATLTRRSPSSTRIRNKYCCARCGE
jgi:hypothetical protein